MRCFWGVWVGESISKANNKTIKNTWLTNEAQIKRFFFIISFVPEMFVLSHPLFLFVRPPTFSLNVKSKVTFKCIEQSCAKSVHVWKIHRRMRTHISCMIWMYWGGVKCIKLWSLQRNARSKAKQKKAPNLDDGVISYDKRKGNEHNACCSIGRCRVYHVYEAVSGDLMIK